MSLGLKWCLWSCSRKRFLLSKTDALRSIFTPYLHFGLGTLNPNQTRMSANQKVTPSSPNPTSSLLHNSFQPQPEPKSNLYLEGGRGGERRCFVELDPLSVISALPLSVYFTLFSRVLGMYKWLGKLGWFKVMVFCIIWFPKIISWPSMWDEHSKINSHS